MERYTAARIRNAISSYNPETMYRVEAGVLYVTAPGGLLPEQRELIREHKPELVAFLTEPPEQSGTCIHSHTLVWKCTNYGIWVCICYFIEQIAPASSPEPEPEKLTTHDYWTQKEGSSSVLPSSMAQKAGIKRMNASQSTFFTEYTIDARERGTR